MTSSESEDKKTLFIPLNTEYFEQFKSGVKSAEYRIQGGAWNEKNVYAGRRVVLSKGYGKGDRLTGIIASVQVKPLIALPRMLQNTLVKIYQGKAFGEARIMCIEIRVDR